MVNCSIGYSDGSRDGLDSVWCSSLLLPARPRIDASTTMPRDSEADDVEVYVFRGIFTAPPFIVETARFLVSFYFMNDFVVLQIQDAHSAVYLRTEYQVALSD